MLVAPSLHILLVEDNDSLREATADFLRSQGHRVTAVVSAEEVDDTPTQDLPDLYLIDVNLPGEDGFSLAKRVRRSHPLVGMILITARSQLQDRLDGYDCGADNYLIKPVERSELLGCLASLARRLKALALVQSQVLVLDAQRMELSGPRGHATLNQAESLLLAALARAPGGQLERWQAMRLVDPQQKGLVPANLEMRVSGLRRKLAACGAPQDAIRTLRSFGYALACPIEVR